MVFSLRIADSNKDVDVEIMGHKKSPRNPGDQDAHIGQDGFLTNKPCSKTLSCSGQLEAVFAAS